MGRKFGVCLSRKWNSTANHRNSCPLFQYKAKWDGEVVTNKLADEWCPNSDKSHLVSNGMTSVSTSHLT